MTDGKRTILGVFSHPDDECMGPGGTLARYTRDGHRVAFACATEGGAGRLHEKRPKDRAKLRAIRREELARAAAILGVEFVGFLGYEDQGLVTENILEVELALVELLRRERPDVVMTYHPSGISYHPDHRVMTLALVGAFQGAGRATWYREARVAKLEPHRPRKLYYYAPSAGTLEALHWPREIYGASEEEITTRIDTRAYQDVRWEAIQAHDSQRNGPPFRRLYDAGFFEEETFVRVFPGRVPGETTETDLLAGLD